MKIKKKKIIIVILTLMTLIIIGYFSGFIRSHFENNGLKNELIKEVKTETIDLNLANYPDLPEPVKKYFEYTFNGQKSIEINHVFWKEKGTFKLPVSEDDFNIDSAQTSLVTLPKYLWQGLYKNATTGLPFIESRDAFFIDSHNMRAKLLGIRDVMTTKYDEQDEKKLHVYLMLRYYGTALDFPWMLLPSEYIKWLPKDDNHAYLELTLNRVKGNYLVTFNEKNQITRLETEEFMLHGNNELLREVGDKSNYEEINGFMIPTHMEYNWYEQDGELNSKYIFNITEIKYVK